MTIPGFDGDVSVDDRASECMTAIARTYEEGLAHLEFLARLWVEPIRPAVPALPVMTPVADEPAEPVVAAPVVAAQPVEPIAAAEPVLVAEPAAPLLAEEPAMLPMAVVATDVPAPVSPDAPTAVELPVVVLPEPVLDESVLDEAEEIVADATEADDAHVLLFAEAATAEIPVQAAA